MSRHRQPPYPRSVNLAWHPAIERLDQVLEQNHPTDYSETIEILGMVMFGDLWRPCKPESPATNS